MNFPVRAYVVIYIGAMYAYMQPKGYRFDVSLGQQTLILFYSFLRDSFPGKDCFLTASNVVSTCWITLCHVVL